MEGGEEEGAPTASGGKSSTHTVGSEQQETDKVGRAFVGKLGPGDLRDVLTELFDVRVNWENIGLALELTDGTIRAIGAQYKDPKDCLRDMLRDWLNMSDASWSSLVQALRHPIVGERNLAAELERKYLTQEHTSTASPSPYQPPSLPPHHPISVQPQFPAPSHLPYLAPGYHAQHLSHPLTDHHPSVGYTAPSIPQAVHVHRPTMWPWPQPYTSAAPYQPPFLPTLPPDYPISVQQHFPASSQLQYLTPIYHTHHFSHPLTDHPPSVGYTTPPIPQAVHVHSPAMWPEPPWQISNPMGSCLPTNCPTKHVHPPMSHLHSPSLQSTHSSPIPQDGAPHTTSHPHSRPSLAPTTITGGMHPPTAFTHSQDGREHSTAASNPSTSDPQLGPMELFAESLTAEYERVSATCEEKLYPTSTSEYTNLAVIKKGLMSRTEADKFTRSTLHGGLDEIMREKTPVNLEDVFKPDNRRWAVNYVLVEGAPGVGKSTFALELCRRWHAIELMKRFVAVVLLRLRERRVQNAKSVADLLYHDDDDIKQAIVKQVRSRSGKNLLLVLDGFDELPTLLQRSSFIAKVIRGECLKEATILVTSRPSARDSLLSLRPHPDKHIEVLGFTSVLVDQYANSVYGEDLKLLADFRAYVDTNPAIKSMMYVPLNSAIVVEIYREYRTEGRPIPQTMTQLYTELTLVRIRSYLRDQCKRPLDSLPVKLEDLPKKFRDQLSRLAKLAYNGCMNDEVIFERLPIGCTCLGLMTASQEMYVGKKGAVNYNFFHLTHQEFLAACYISHLTLSEKREIFLQCLDGDNSPKMSVVWRFVVGLVGLQDIGWDKYMLWFGRLLCSSLAKEKESEKEEDRGVTPFLAHCLYEAQEKVDWGNPLETFCVTIGKFGMSLSPLDCFTVGYCVAASKWIWDLDFRCCKLEPEMVAMLVCGLKSKQQVNGSIRKLLLGINLIRAEGVAHLQELPREILCGISCLGVEHCRLDSAALDLLSGLVSTMTSLKELDIRGNGVHGETGNILRSLSTVKQLQTLGIDSINRGPSDIMALSPLIRRSVGSVKELSIGDHAMTREHTGMMLEAVLCPSSLESLQLFCVCLTPRVATLLQDNHNLIKLCLAFCTAGTISHIAKGLHNQTTLRELRVFTIVQLTTDDVIALSEMLRKNQSLKAVTFAPQDFTKEDVETLVSALQDNHTLEHLYLRYIGREFPQLELHLLEPRVSISRWS